MRFIRGSVNSGVKSNMLAKSKVVAGFVSRWSADPEMGVRLQLYSMKLGIDA